jgi:DNA end-binding protein Ku
MPRTLWKGAISFGLVHIPVGLYPASQEDDIDFDWLDKRTLDPVGYKRINKRTGKEITKEHIVKGVERGQGQYVVLSDEEIRNAYPKTTQTIEIESFVKAGDIPFVYLERPYYLAPINKGDKVYALLRETLLAAGRIGLARVVIQTKQHLAALVPAGPALMLNTLRWPSEIRTWEELKLPPEGSKAAGIKPAELDMARALVEDMSKDWEPEDYHNEFRDAVMALVEKKHEAGDVHEVTPQESTENAAPSNVIDLTELLKRSLAGKKGKTDEAGTSGASSKVAKSGTAKSATARKRTSAATAAPKRKKAS